MFFRPPQGCVLHKSNAFNQMYLKVHPIGFVSGGLQAFRGFLRSEFSEENLKFWLACENYRVSPSKAKASSIYSQFINPDAPLEVSGECDKM